jgi:hypothetical protein
MGRTLAKATNAVTFCQEGAPVDDARIATTDGLAAYNDEKTGRRNVQHQIAEFQALERELSELILTTDAVARAKQLVREIPGSIMLDQFSNPANPKIHRRMTVLEIWDDTGGAVDVFISAVGTEGAQTCRSRYRHRACWRSGSFGRASRQASHARHWRGVHPRGVEPLHPRRNHCRNG